MYKISDFKDESEMLTGWIQAPNRTENRSGMCDPVKTGI
jgi:hypothetical protein